MQEEGIEGEVQGREKHLYSIYRKMAERKRPLDDIVDVYGFRIIVNDVNTCYRLLGVVHGASTATSHYTQHFLGRKDCRWKCRFAQRK